MVDLHEITREGVIDFLVKTEHPMFKLVHEIQPEIAESIAIGGAMTILVALAEADGFMTAEQLEVLAIICNKLRRTE